jgi:hypothetical protein
VIEAPPADDVAITYQPEELTELNLLRAGVSTLIWATGYYLDCGWIDAPTLDELAIPETSAASRPSPASTSSDCCGSTRRRRPPSSGLSSTAHTSSKRWPVTRPRGTANTARFCGVDHSRDERRNKAAPRSS